MKMLITGSVQWKDHSFILDKFEKLILLYPSNEIFTLIHFGITQGVDFVVEKKLVNYNNTNVIKYRAKNELLTSKILRNNRIFKFDRPQLIWVFHNNINLNEGLRDLITKAHRRKIPVTIFRSENE